ncbi:MAG: RNA 2',3'-cyclic phosphodiesterase [Rhodohalobacter sp.]|uniref:RNA 2',3'-cyclic phosphodiesterase n=1 Tax=Rhodohalobacter sp. TaxID=1974210 RepID=UPI003976C551
MSRYFISITLPEDLQYRIDQILPEDRYWKKTDRRQLHLTLRYIGEANDVLLKELEDKLAMIDIPEFNLRLKEIGFFPRKGTVRVIWLGVEKSLSLIKLQGAVDKAVTEVMHRESEYSFTPHVTLARVKGRIREDEIIRMLPEFEESFTCEVQSFQLMESKQGRDGVEHVPARSYQLKKD